MLLKHPGSLDVQIFVSQEPSKNLLRFYHGVAFNFPVLKHFASEVSVEHNCHITDCIHLNALLQHCERASFDAIDGAGLLDVSQRHRDYFLRSGLSSHKLRLLDQLLARGFVRLLVWNQWRSWIVRQFVDSAHDFCCVSFIQFALLDLAAKRREAWSGE